MRAGGKAGWGLRLLWGVLLASCSVDLDDLAAGERSPDPSDASAGSAGSAGSGAAGFSGSSGAAGTLETGGAAGSAGVAGANRDGAGAAGTGRLGGFAGSGAGGATGLDADVDSAGRDASEDDVGAGGSGGQSGDGGSGAAAGAAGADARTDAMETVETGPMDAPSEGDAKDGGALCQGGVCKRVFVTASPPPTGGNLGGLGGADAFCQSSADANMLGGHWKAWLSDATTSASARLTHETVPYVLLDGTTVAANWGALTSGTLAHAIDMSQDGTIQTGILEVWTASTSAGAFSGRSCSGWTNDASGSATADVGKSSETNPSWSNAFQQYCDRMNVHLYCFEQ